jgi:hypothetical protein
MRHGDIRTTMNIYGDVVTDEMQQAHSKVVGLASPQRSANRAQGQLSALKWRKRVGVEQTPQCTYNNLERGRWHLTRLITHSSVLTARKRHGDEAFSPKFHPSFWRG